MNDKTCSQCLVTKDISLFAKAVTCVGGFRTNCKACQKIIKGKLVCGLHVEDNLRIIPADLNMKKGNDYSII